MNKIKFVLLTTRHRCIPYGVYQEGDPAIENIINIKGKNFFYEDIFDDEEELLSQIKQDCTTFDIDLLKTVVDIDTIRKLTSHIEEIKIKNMS